MIYGTIGIHPHESSKNIITSRRNNPKFKR